MLRRRQNCVQNTENLLEFDQENKVIFGSGGATFKLSICFHSSFREIARVFKVVYPSYTVIYDSNRLHEWDDVLSLGVE